MVRNLGAPSGLASERDVEDFEQELVDQFVLAMVGAGMSDGMVERDRSVIFEFVRFLRPPGVDRPAGRR